MGQDRQLLFLLGSSCHLWTEMSTLAPLFVFGAEAVPYFKAQ